MISSIHEHGIILHFDEGKKTWLSALIFFFHLGHAYIYLDLVLSDPRCCCKYERDC